MRDKRREREREGGSVYFRSIEVFQLIQMTGFES